jgi:hypothetical protein
MMKFRRTPSEGLPNENNLRSDLINNNQSLFKR